MRIAVLGGGAMGNVLTHMINEKQGFEVAGMVEPTAGETLEGLGEADVVIDFSNPANLGMLTNYCKEQQINENT